MILVFIAFFIIIQNRILTVQEDKNQQTLGEIKEAIKTELSIAEEANDGFSRKFFLPLKVSGVDYFLQLNDSEIRIAYNGIESPLFLVPDVKNYSISPGFNRISKFSKKISIVNSSARCGDGVVEAPNFDYIFEECDGASDSRCPGLCNVTTCYCPLG